MKIAWMEMKLFRLCFVKFLFLFYSRPFINIIIGVPFQYVLAYFLPHSMIYVVSL